MFNDNEMNILLERVEKWSESKHKNKFDLYMILMDQLTDYLTQKNKETLEKMSYQQNLIDSYSNIISKLINLNNTKGIL